LLNEATRFTPHAPAPAAVTPISIGF